MEYIYSTKDDITVAGYPVFNHLGTSIHGGSADTSHKKNLVIPVGLVIVHTSTNVPIHEENDDIHSIVDDDKFDELFSMCGEIEGKKKKNTSHKKK